MSDVISRQAAIDRINKQREHLQPDIYPQDKIGDAAYRICAEFIERLPSAEPQIIACGEGELSTNLAEVGTDCISRQAALDIFDDYNVAVENGQIEAYSRNRKRLCDLPPAQPERIKGRWVYHSEWANDGECGYECSVCHMGSDIDYNFCMRCGADMREEKEK